MPLQILNLEYKQLRLGEWLTNLNRIEFPVGDLSLKLDDEKEVFKNMSKYNLFNLTNLSAAQIY